MIYLPQFNPNIFEFGPISIKWYGLAYVCGILLSVFYIEKMNDKFKLFPKKLIDDFINYYVIAIIIGGRIGYVILYSIIHGDSRYFTNFFDIFKIWEGGMSFHGGVIGVIVATYALTRKHATINHGKIFWNIIDLIASITPIGLFFGRIANFINGELFGRPTNFKFAVIYPGEKIARHASQLYEAFFEGLILLIIMQFMVFKKNAINTPSLLSSIFLICYGIFRFSIEFFRQPDSQIGFVFNNLTMGQILSIPMILLGTFLLMKVQRATRNS